MMAMTQQLDQGETSFFMYVSSEAARRRGSPMYQIEVDFNVTVMRM